MAHTPTARQYTHMFHDASSSFRISRIQNHMHEASENIYIIWIKIWWWFFFPWLWFFMIFSCGLWTPSPIRFSHDIRQPHRAHRTAHSSILIIIECDYVSSYTIVCSYLYGHMYMRVAHLPYILTMFHYKWWNDIWRAQHLICLHVFAHSFAYAVRVRTWAGCSCSSKM